MSDLNPELEKILNNLGLSAQDVIKANQRLRDSNTDTVKSLTRQAMEMAAAHKQRIAAAERELKADGLRGDALKKEARVRADLQRTLEDQADDEEKSLRRSQEIDKKREDGIKKFISTIGAMGTSAISASSSFYASKDVFTSVIPTLDLVGNAFKGVVEATAMMLTGYEIAGFSLGKAAEGAAKLAGIVTDVSIKTAQMQLEMSQKYLNTYNTLSAAGVTFGGNLNDMSRAAHDGGLDLQTYGDFVKKNIESLSAMGGTVEQSANRIMKMSKAVTDGNDKLLIMFGGFEGVNDALAFHNKMLAQTGYDTVKNQDKISAGSTAYLTTLKELQELTGLSVDQQQKIQEEANRDIAWRMKLAELRNSGQEARADAMEANYKVVFAMKGAKAAEMYKEKESLDGQLLSQGMLMLRAQSSGLDEYTSAMRQTTTMSRDARLKEISGITQTADARFKVELANNASNLKIFQYAGDTSEYAKSMSESVLQQLNTLDKSSNIEATVQKIIEDTNKPLGEASANVAAALRAKLAGNIEIDNLIEKQLAQMAKITQQLITLQVTLINTFGPKLTSAVDSAIAGLLTLGGVAAGGAGGGGTNKGINWGKVGSEAASGAGRGAVAGGAIGLAGFGAGAIPGAGIGAGVGGAVYGGAELIKQWYNQTFGGEEEGTKGDKSSIRALIASVESGGNYGATVKAGTQDLTNMTIADVIKNGSQFGAAGKYQFISSTLAQVAKEANIPFTSKYSADVQDRLADQLIEDMGYGKYKSGSMGKADFLKSIAGQWRGLPNSPGMIAGQPTDSVGNKANISWDGAMAKFAKGGITNGTSIAGEAGPEAVVPLPDGRTIPVKMDTAGLIDKLDELLSVMKDNRDYSEKISRSVA